MNPTHETPSDRILELLTELSVNPFKHEELMRDPAGVLSRAGLSEAEQQLLSRWLRGETSGMQRRLSAAFIDPGDDPSPNPDPIPAQVFELPSP